MPDLVVTASPVAAHLALVSRALEQQPNLRNTSIEAGLWLYVDDLNRSHVVSQQLDDITGAFWHGIMHRREGDFSNSHYWFSRVGHHPAMDAMEGYDGHAFIDEVSGQYRVPTEDLLDRQRQEWRTLFAWCARKAFP
jgi:hypothetical protein